MGDCMFSGLNMFPTGGSNLSFLKVLGGLSKTLGIARQIMPLYTEIKPIVSKIPVILSSVSQIRPKNINYNFKEDTDKNMRDELDHFASGPQFFQ